MQAQEHCPLLISQYMNNMVKVLMLHPTEQQLDVADACCTHHHCHLHTEQYNKTVTWVMAGVLVLHSTEPA